MKYGILGFAFPGSLFHGLCPTNLGFGHCSNDGFDDTAPLMGRKETSTNFQRVEVGCKKIASVTHMGVSKNRGTPQIIHFNKVFHCKPSILGVPLFLETPIYCEGSAIYDIYGFQ